MRDIFDKKLLNYIIYQWSGNCDLVTDKTDKKSKLVK